MTMKMVLTSYKALKPRIFSNGKIQKHVPIPKNFATLTNMKISKFDPIEVE